MQFMSFGYTHLKLPFKPLQAGFLPNKIPTTFMKHLSEKKSLVLAFKRMEETIEHISLSSLKASFLQMNSDNSVTKTFKIVS